MGRGPGPDVMADSGPGSEGDSHPSIHPSIHSFMKFRCGAEKTLEAHAEAKRNYLGSHDPLWLGLVGWICRDIGNPGTPIHSANEA